MATFTASHPPDPRAVGDGVAGDPSWQLIVLDGTIDVAIAPVLATTLVASVTLFDLGAGVVVDLSHITSIDAEGLNALLAAREHLQSCGRDLVVRGASPSVLGMLDLVGSADMAEQPGNRRMCRFAC